MKNFFKKLTPSDAVEIICLILFVSNTIVYFMTKEYRLGFATIISILWLLMASMNRRANYELTKQIEILQKELEEK